MSPFQQVRQRTSQTAADHLPQKAQEDTKEEVGRGSQASASSANVTDHAVAGSDPPLQKPRLGDSSCIRLLFAFCDTRWIVVMRFPINSFALVDNTITIYIGIQIPTASSW
ncbi:hypothetical protein [Stieleria neptunia]|uniref:hypothetical protein n=1 Tax=Stieleria neptunia TaxID=2527979 RepID=UPI0011A6FF5F|nr:hypothetical protein [Stieleria neptunia]